MERILLVVNSEKDMEYNAMDEICRILAEKGLRYKSCDSIDFQNASPDEISVWVSGCDMIMVLGGDGTLLSAAGAVSGVDIPLYGINLGTVGFLTEGEMANAADVIDRLSSGDYKVERRMMIRGTVKKQGETPYSQRALNDVVITRAGFSRLIAFNVYVNGKLLDAYEADGVVVATPTGSTGYNLSAGGPIVSPSASLIVITPVSPHSLTSKSIVLSADDKIDIEVVKVRKTQDTEAIVSFDGGSSLPLSAGDRIEIERSQAVTELIKLSNVSFYEILRNKLGGK